MSKRNWSGFPGRRFSPLAIVGMVIGGLVLAVIFAFLFGWVVMLLWNWLMPAIFGLTVITYWQAWGLVLLSHILIKGGWGGGHGDHKDRDEDCGSHRKRGMKPVEGDWCESCTDCDWQTDCAKYSRGWRRTADGWKCDTANLKKDLADRMDETQSPDHP